jgi:MFS family permease
MDATVYSAAIGRRNVALLSAIRGSIAALLCVVLAFAAVFLFARCLAGALNQPLSAATLVGVGIAAALTAEAVRLLDRQSNRHSTAKLSSAARQWLPRLALPMIALSVSAPGSSKFGLALLWLTIVGQEYVSWKKRPISRPGNPPYRALGSAAGTLFDESRRLPERSPPADWLNPAVAQQIAHRRSAEGSAIVEGWVRANFVADQRTAIVHVAFCPPFPDTPQIDVEPVNGPACDIRPTLVLPWGVRWEVRLVEPAAEAASVVLEFFAAEKAPMLIG